MSLTVLMVKSSSCLYFKEAELVLVQELSRIDFHPPWGSIVQISSSMAMGTHHASHTVAVWGDGRQVYEKPGAKPALP